MGSTIGEDTTGLPSGYAYKISISETSPFVKYSHPFNEEGDSVIEGFFVGGLNELLSKVVFELKIKRQSGFQESPRFHQRIVHLQSPLPGNQSHVTFSNSFLHIVPA